ncbi:hypothetical protein RN001_007676 [Aquatica leii]|uniref:THAP-type domain-containing protein n=1 Tax=Aquatica leii TaxID=1421715 RepID=A0AAN7Q4H8_9COLE|nr:hypothetical protein RN001_007676 [Aquatica leii]
MAFCAYFECTQTRKSNSKISFFRFPTNHRKTDWLNNCGNPHFFDLTDEQLREKRVCALHFVEKHFVNVNKNRLLHDAVPVNYKSGQLLHENLLNSGIGVIKSPEKLTLRKNGLRKCYRNSNPDSTRTAVKISDSHIRPNNFQKCVPNLISRYQ